MINDLFDHCNDIEINSTGIIITFIFRQILFQCFFFVSEQDRGS